MLVLVGKNDAPLFQIKLWNMKVKDESVLSLGDFILHSSLDILEHIEWQNNQSHFKNFDKYGELIVSGFLTPGFTKILLLHEGKSDEAIKNFFLEIYELYVKALMNPFQEPNSAITSATFESKVRDSGKKYF